MNIARFLRLPISKQSASSTNSAARRRNQHGLEMESRDSSLESRTLMATDLILDFDGGNLVTGQNYSFPQGFGGLYTAWPGFPTTGTTGVPNRQENILQLLAGVREDYAAFDVRVIWDDMGTGSPLFNGQDSVVMIVGDQPDPNLYGIAASVDINQANGREVALTFGPLHNDNFAGGPFTYNRFREIIDTTSHEGGHVFGLSHTSEADSQGRQLVSIAPQNRDFNSRFSPESLNHSAPENGVRYTEIERLNRNVGANPKGNIGDTISAQMLPLDPTGGRINFAPEVKLNGRIDYFGDRDAYRFTATTSGRFGVRQEAADGGQLFPRITLWNNEGDFLASGLDEETFSQVEFDLVAGQTYWAVAGSQAEKDFVNPGSETPNQTGDFVITIGAPTSPNRAPVIGAIAEQVVNEGDSLNFKVGATDRNAADILTYSLMNAPAGMTIDSQTGIVRWPTTDGPFTQMVTVMVTDNHPTKPLSATAQFRVTVENVAPTLNINSVGVMVFELAGGLTQNLTFNEPGGNDGVTGTVNFGDGAVTAMAPVNTTNRTVNLNHTYATLGTFSITVTLTDKDGASTTQSYQVASVLSTNTQTNLVVSSTRLGFSSGLSIVDVFVNPQIGPAPGPSGVVDLIDDNGKQSSANVVEGRGSAVVTFERETGGGVVGTYNSKGTGYKVSKSTKVSLNGPKAAKLLAAKKVKPKVSSGANFTRR